jgi:hypothetical protein
LQQLPARLHALLARDAPVGVVFRRGPADAVCTLLWDRTNDSFQLGQWLRGRIYERRTDISPDGRHLIYFARGGQRHAETRGSWTAISRTPWLRAVTLFGKGNCWQGGGLFTSDSSYWLNGCDHFLVRDSEKLERDREFRPCAVYNGECPGIYYPRLQRDGWSLKERLTAGVFNTLAVFEKPMPNGWLLRKYAHEGDSRAAGRACYWDEHELEMPGTSLRRTFPDWEWADADGDSLVWAEHGCLKRARLTGEGIGAANTLYDFTPMQFETRVAPY